MCGIQKKGFTVHLLSVQLVCNKPKKIYSSLSGNQALRSTISMTINMLNILSLNEFINSKFYDTEQLVQ